jgi:hypothetical protein
MGIEALSRLVFRSALLAVVLVLTGCWTAPVATVQPRGDARLIQDAIPVTRVKDAAVVSSVDRDAGTIVLRALGGTKTSTYKIGPKVSRLEDIKTGDLVRATVAEELAVYVLRDGQLPGVGHVAADARVLMVDPSYRLLTLQYPDGANETLKVPLGTQLGQMEAGNSVVIRPVAVLSLRRRG